MSLDRGAYLLTLLYNFWQYFLLKEPPWSRAAIGSHGSAARHSHLAAVHRLLLNFFANTQMAIGSVLGLH
jgi:hypothetical protein